MKHLFLLGTVACTIGLFSCSKEKTVTVKEIVYPNGQVNADSLTAAVTVGYGTNVADANFPAASTSADAPRLDSLFSGSYVAPRGGHLTIYPSNVFGYVQGYYVQIVGAKSYFKIDYPAAEEARKQARKGQDQDAARGYGEGNIDGTIAITMPAAVNGDTFYVKYAAYDKENRVSKPVTALVVVKNVLTSSIADSLNGTWRRVSNANYSYGVLGDYRVDTAYEYSNYYQCVDNKLVPTFNSSDLDIPTYRNSYIYMYAFNGLKADFISGYIYADIDLANSTCDKPAYTITNRVDTTDMMGYTFDPASRKITIYESNATYYTYRISSLTSKELVLAGMYTGDVAEGYFQKYIKQ